MREIRLGNIYGATGGNYAGWVYDKYGLAPTLNTAGGGGRQPMIIESIKDAQTGDWLWRIDDDTYYIRIRRLTPKECWRLMGFSDEDFDKARAINSDTQLYKQAGNSISKNVLCELFKQLL